MSSYLVTGCARGIGLCLAQLLAARPKNQVSLVFATARKPSQELEKLVDEHKGRVVIVLLDQSDKASIERAVQIVEEKLGGRGLDVLINSAGVSSGSGADGMPNGADVGGVVQMNDLMSTLAVNVEGVHNVTRAFLPLLAKGATKKVLNISSTMSSMAWAAKFMFQDTPAYKISKAALNALTVQYSLYHKEEGFIISACNPGWLRTRMGSENADLPVEVGCNAVLDIVDHLKPEDTGKLFEINVPQYGRLPSGNIYAGGEIPW